MAAAYLHTGYANFDTESLRSFTSTFPDDCHDWASESGQQPRWVINLELSRFEVK